MKKLLLTKRALCVVLAVLFVFLSYAVFLAAFGRRYSVCVNFTASDKYESAEVLFGDKYKESKSELVELTGIKVYDDHIKAHFKSTARGTEPVIVRAILNGGARKQAALDSIRVSFGGIILNNMYRDFYIVFSVIALLLLVYYVFLFVHTLKTDRYSYNSIFFLAVSLFLALLLCVWVSSAVYSFARFHAAYSDIIFTVNQNLLAAVILASFPFTVIFTVSVTVSNLRLIMKEGARPANALGIAASFIMGLGILAIIALFYINRNYDFAAVPIIQAVVSALYVFFEVMLVATIFCGIYVARYEPGYDKDYIIILGCRIRKDGTLFPLVRGRADRAIAFYKKQLEKAGKEAYFIPSGGKGSDEIMPEAEAIKNYLVEQGIPESRIIPETRSATTKENMKFSKAIIDEREKDAKLVFSTTNYHVFRSGIIASEAGIKAEGIGSRTKWYFWPNAFLRETAGLFFSKPKKQLLLLLLLSVAAGMGSWFYSIM